MAAPAGPSTPAPSGASREAFAGSGATAFQQVMQAGRANPLLVLGVVLVTLLAAIVWIAQRSPTYEARAKILVVPLAEDRPSDPRLPLVRASGDRTRTIQTAANLLDTHRAATLAARRLGGEWTPESVAAATDVVPQGESDVLAVTARADDGRTTARVANQYAEAALEARELELRPLVAELVAETQAELRAQRDPASPVAAELAERLAELGTLRDGTDPTLSLAEAASIPTSPLGPSTPLILALALFAGVVLGSGSAVLKEALAPPRVMDEGELVGMTGLPVLGRIPALPLTARVPLPRRTPRVPAAAATPLRSLLLELELDEARAIMIGSPSSRDGKTTTVMQLALILTHLGRSVLVVDLDPSRPRLATQLGVSTGDDSRKQTQAATWRDALLPVPGEPALEVFLAPANGRGLVAKPVLDRLNRILEEAPNDFDHVLVDAPALMEAYEALRVAPLVDADVLVVRLGRTTVEATETATQLLEGFGRRPRGLVVIGGRSAARSTRNG
jgi:Mrp family chromosome partitioning ATPase